MEEDYIQLGTDRQEDKIETEPEPKRKKFNPFRTINRKEDKEKRQFRRARIIVRNISYKATDETLKKHFENYGKVLEVNLLKRPDGKLVGCAFIQFDKVNEAAKAILKATNKEFLGRPVYVDWAVGKDQFVQKKNEGGEEDNPEIKEEKEEEDDAVDIKEEEEEPDTVEDMDTKVKEEDDENEDSDEAEDDEEDEEELGSEDENEDEEDEDTKFSGVKTEVKEDPDAPKQKRISNDVTEGCTIFIKNVPFDITDQDLRKFCRRYGPIYYAIINKDSLSGHSKGTAFVKFKTKQSADMCLKAGEEFRLMDQVMEPLPALSRDEVKQKNDAKKNKEPSDSRNLYLLREGLIMANSKAAEGVSASDMAKRHKLELIKSQILRNLKRFVSRNRLSVHNLPPSYDDEKLRDMIIQHTGFKPHECRVMREKLPSPGHPDGKSKGFGFMSFKTHDEALMALRKLNNNPKVFGSSNRPILSFSIEDRSVHNIKEKRIERSKENNPTFKNKLEKLKEKKKEKKLKKKKTEQNGTDSKSEVQKVVKEVKLPKNRKRKLDTENSETEVDQFIGTSAKPGTQMNVRSTWKLNQQSKDHSKKLSKQKRLVKAKKERQRSIKERQEKGVQKKKKNKPQKDDFSALVESYKNVMTNALDKKQKLTRTKWYKE